MNKSLRKYIKEQADNNVDPQYVRYNLLRAGWPQGEVDTLLTDIYAKNDSSAVHGNPHLLRGLVIVVLLMLVVMFGIYQFILNKPANYSPPPPGPQDNVSMGGDKNPVVQDDCTIISDSVQKDACYQKKVREGFYCETLNDKIEKNFCLRALDVYIMAY